MEAALPIFGVAFAAFCVWLAVRIVNRRERWAKWTLAAAIGIPALYIASFGPACWITSRIEFGASKVPIFYLPVIWCMAHDKRDRRVAHAIMWYSEFGAAKDWQWVDISGSAIYVGSFYWMNLNDPSAGGGMFSQ